ncbi:MAG: hypothetical protein LC798_20280 [Chloroflexi bacterium]|nr:hypothetical protein [Chloroflexota bacterium]
MLISFYRDRPASAQAGTKAFLMNRIGDAHLLVAMFLLVAHTGTLGFGEVFTQASALPAGVIEGVGFLLLVGAAGKSAQLPLGTWLARAMEGPTPSSALMHAATMVTAGVYLVVRSAPIYEQAPTALIAVGIVGTVTALYGQLVGYVQTDIKGLLAASTTAQLGLMFLFCGLGLYAVAVFHLVAHAFYKSLVAHAFYKSYLFLTAPSILHHLHGGPDPTIVRSPEDTARRPAAVALAAAAGLLAAPLVGLVRQQAGGFNRNVWVVLALGLIAAFAAVFATRRMTEVAFAGHTAGEDHAGTGHGADDRPSHRARGTPWARLAAPLGFLAGLVALGLGFNILPGGLDGSWFQRLLGQVAAGSGDVPLGNPLLATVFLSTVALLLISGWYGPRYLDRFRDELPATATPPIVRRLYWWALNRGYLDDTYDRYVVAPTAALGRALERFDRAVLDRPAPVTQPGVLQPATWEARFVALHRGAGPTVIAEPSERLDWLPAATGAAIPEEHDRPVAVARRAMAWSRGASEGGGVFGAVADAGARLAEGMERRVFQPAAGGGVFGAVASAGARLAEGMERRVFQSVDTTTLKLTGIIAGFTDAVEKAVFDTGVERGLARAGAGAQRLLLAIERQLGQPLVIGSILALALLALIVGTR